MAEVTLTIPDAIMTKLSNKCDIMFTGRPGSISKTDWIKHNIYILLEKRYKATNMEEQLNAIVADTIDIEA